jgi:phage tail-like protein
MSVMSGLPLPSGLPVPSVPSVPSVPTVGGAVNIAAQAAKGDVGKVSDPANSLRFNFKIDGVEIPSFTAVDGLSAEYVVKTYEEGGQNDYIHQLPGRIKYNNLKLTRPVDSGSKALAAWFTALGTSQTLRRRTATIIAYNDNREVVAQWSFRDVYPVRYTGPSFSAENGKVLTETLEIAHNGFTT